MAISWGDTSPNGQRGMAWPVQYRCTIKCTRCGFTDTIYVSKVHVDAGYKRICMVCGDPVEIVAKTLYNRA